MVEMIGLILLGVVLIALGIVNISGNISTIHWYNRRKVSPEDVPKYGRLVGIGTCLIGVFVVLSGILVYVFTRPELYILVIPGVISGLLLMLIAQFKYNKGIF